MSPSVDPTPRVPPAGNDPGRADDLDRALLAPYRLRLLAFVVDVAVATLVPLLLVLVGALTLPDLPVPWWSVALMIVPAGLAAIGGLSVWLTGGLTLGKAVCGLTERRLDGSPVAADLTGLAWSLTRHSIGYVVVDVLGLGAVVAVVHSRRQCLHNVVFRDEVVYLPGPGGSAVAVADRGRAFSELLQAGMERVRERYGWMAFLLRWWVRVILVVASLVFFLVRTSALALAAPATTPAVASTAAPSLVGPAGTAALVASTSAATIALVAVVVPEGQRSYTGLALARTVAIEEPGPAGWDPTSGTFVVASGERVVSVDPGSGRVVHSDPVARSVSDVLVDPPTGTIWVSSSLDDTVTVLDADGLDVLGTVDLDWPVDLVHSPVAGVVYVAGHWGSVTALDTRTRTAVGTISVPLRPGALEYSVGRMAVDPGNQRLYVAIDKLHVGANYVSVVDTASGEEVAQIDVDLDPDGLVVDPVSHRLYLSEDRDTLSIIDTDTHALVEKWEIPAGYDSHGGGLALDLPSGTIAVLGYHHDALTVVDAATGTVVDTLVFEEQTTEVAVDADTGTVLVAAFYDDLVHVLQPE